LPSKKVLTFKDFYYSTENSAVGEEIASKCGREFWRIDNLRVKIGPKVVETEEVKKVAEQPVELPVEEPKKEEPPKRRGRPPRIVQGMRMSEEQGEEL